MHLILDIDGTLISDDMPIIFRPYLAEFLMFCFKSFETVSIWSAASENHVKSIADQILPKDCQWLFIRHSKHCHKKYYLSEFDFDGSYMNLIVEKRLRNIWKCSKFRNLGIKRENTIIIENTPSICAKNYGNAIYVKTFEGNLEDRELMKLIIYLKELIQTTNVRIIEKRNWKHNIYSRDSIR